MSLEAGGKSRMDEVLPITDVLASAIDKVYTSARSYPKVPLVIGAFCNCGSLTDRFRIAYGSLSDRLTR